MDQIFFARCLPLPRSSILSKREVYSLGVEMSSFEDVFFAGVLLEPSSSHALDVFFLAAPPFSL